MIVFVNPNENIKNIFLKDPNVIFIDHNGFWKYSEKNSKRVLLPFLADSFFDDSFGIPDIKKKLNWWMPLFTRWVPNADRYELIKDELLILIFEIIKMFKLYKINSVVFFTSIPHHLPSAVISIVAQFSKIKQIFLYFQIINGRLLPIEQIGEIDNRYPIKYDLNEIKCSDNLKFFIKNKIENKQPIYNIKERAWKKSIIVALCYLFKKEISKALFKFNFLKERKKSIFITKNMSESSLIEDLRTINSQRLFLKKMSNSVISQEKVLQLKNKGPYLLLAAHFQPEATTFPEGGSYNSHIEIILELRKKKYKSNILYKEHFGSSLYLDKVVGLTKVGISRSESYVDILRDLGCIFLPQNFDLSVKDNFDWYLPITITGTIALERSLAGLHTIYAGEPWYKGMPGTINLKDIKTLKEIPSSWLVFDPKIKKNAFEFIEKTLNHKTIANAPGIGSGIKNSSVEVNKDFEINMKKIIEKLKEKFVS